MKSVELSELAVLLHPHDDVAVARRDLLAGTRLTWLTTAVTVGQDVPAGHKLALSPVATGQPVRKYDQVIGYATQDIRPGDYVHLHNLGFGSGEVAHDLAVGSAVRPVAVLPVEQQATFEGYLRADGRVGTRNYLAVVATVNCSSGVAHAIARRFDDVARQQPNLDGVLALTTKGGCGGKPGWETELFQRTLAGFAKHPNVAAYIVVGLGCEGNQMAEFIETGGLLRLDVGPYDRPPTIVMQEVGGTQAAIDQGVRAIEALIPAAAACRRTTQPASRLTLALECGGSDALSGITANPAVGACVDELVRHGGTAVLGETPEVYGAEHLLTRRAVSPAVADKLMERIAWWKHYTATNGFSIDNNPAPGNKDGGLTTIFEKSLGAVAKAGTTPLQAVYEYGATVAPSSGLVHMDTPGYDPVATTGQVAGGCNLVAFTTGRGSCFGFKPAPVLKIATNTSMYERMRADMDINAGTIFDGQQTVAEVGQAIFERLLRLASGEASRSEAQGLGADEYNPWVIGCTM